MKIGIIYGGKSAEHNISIRSVLNVIYQIESLGFDVILIGINQSGRAYLQEKDKVKANVEIILAEKPIYFSPADGIIDSNGNNLEVDCVFPLIHGKYGEDGCLQGLLEVCQIPYIGENVMTSAICMDKHITKIILQQSKIKVTPFIVIPKNEKYPNYAICSKVLGKKLVIKPCSSGSSFGVTLVNCEQDMEAAIILAKTFSDKILIEKYIEGREINCALAGIPNKIGNLGEIINIKSPIYSYEEKYIVKSNHLQIPADLSKSITNDIKLLAFQCFQALQCTSMARIDIFFAHDSQLYINEVNTIPAFSERSIYPRLMESVGVSQKSLLLNLISQAIKI